PYLAVRSQQRERRDAAWYPAEQGEGDKHVHAVARIDRGGPAVVHRTKRSGSEIGREPAGTLGSRPPFPRPAPGYGAAFSRGNGTPRKALVNSTFETRDVLMPWPPPASMCRWRSRARDAGSARRVAAAGPVSHGHVRGKSTHEPLE